MWQWGLAMELGASLALYARGREAWNAWARAMIARRRALVASGAWAWALDSRSDPYPTNQSTADWQNDASAGFSYHEFAEPPNFDGFVFPGFASFVAVKLPRGGSFRSALFCSAAAFNYGNFRAAAAFDDAEFWSEGSFSETKFAGEASFKRCRFVAGDFTPTLRGQLDLSGAAFSTTANFARTRCRRAILAETHFGGPVSFEGASISEMFFLYGTTFRGPVRLHAARLGTVDWSRATFAVPPSR
jgi:hypothetical protein